MRKFLISVAASSMMASSAFAAPHDPLIVWQGGATITAVTAACGAGSQVGNLLQSVYRPRLDPAEPASGLSLIGPRSASSFLRTSGNDQMRGAGTYAGTWLSPRVTKGSGTNTGAYSLTITPSVIAATTPFVTIRGTIKNFQNTVGCNLTFRGSYTLRPN